MKFTCTNHYNPNYGYNTIQRNTVVCIFSDRENQGSFFQSIYGNNASSYRIVDPNTGELIGKIDKYEFNRYFTQFIEQGVAK